MATSDDRNQEIENETNCVEKNNNINSENVLVSIGMEDRRRKRRYPYRPYASPTNRIVKKCGKHNVLNVNIPQKKSRYFKDLGNTLLSIQWRWILVSVCLTNAIVYVTFAILWMIMVAWEESYMDDTNRIPCIIGGSSFSAYLILVVETITTIGSGGIYPTECHSGWIIIIFQAVAGVAIEGALVSAVFVKMSRPRSKDTTKTFSKKALICMRDGIHCLIFRIQDAQEKFLARTTIKAILIKRKFLTSDESSAYYFQHLKLEEVGLMIWPQEVIHKITEESPFWNMSRHDFSKFRFEIMIVLEGDSQTTGQPSQTKTSYTNKEILWGYRFNSCVEYNDTEQKYVVNPKKFNDIVKCELLDHSAREYLFLSNNIIS